MSTRDDASVSGYGPSVDHFEKQTHDRHESPYSADLEMKLDVNRGCAGRCRGGPEWRMLMTSQMGNVKWRASGYTDCWLKATALKPCEAPISAAADALLSVPSSLPGFY